MTIKGVGNPDSVEKNEVFAKGYMFKLKEIQHSFSGQRGAEKQLNLVSGARVDYKGWTIRTKLLEAVQMSTHSILDVQGFVYEDKLLLNLTCAYEVRFWQKKKKAT